MKRLLAGCLAWILMAGMLMLTAPAGAAEESVTIDYHRCCPLLEEIYGERCVEEARQLIDAYLAGESSVVLEGYETGDAPAVESLANDMCPLIGGTVWFGWDDFDDETSTLHWTNVYTPEEMSGYRSRLESVCAGYLEDLRDTDTDLLRYLQLYYAFVSERTYDYDMQEELDACARDEDQAYVNSALRAMIDYTGTCVDFAGCYTFLCIQAGLNAAGAGSQTSETGAHEWNIIELDGKYYYCDPTWDLPDDTGYPSLSHFGITAEERAWDGYSLEETEFDTSRPLITLESLGLDDDRFVLMHGWSFNEITRFEADHETNTVTVTNIDGIESEIR